MGTYGSSNRLCVGHGHACKGRPCLRRTGSSGRLRVGHEPPGACSAGAVHAGSRSRRGTARGANPALDASGQRGRERDGDGRFASQGGVSFCRAGSGSGGCGGRRAARSARTLGSGPSRGARTGAGSTPTGKSDVRGRRSLRCPSAGKDRRGSAVSVGTTGAPPCRRVRGGYRADRRVAHPACRYSARGARLRGVARAPRSSGCGAYGAQAGRSAGESRSGQDAEFVRAGAGSSQA